ncbi:Calcium-binding EF-hand family protein [Abeliophyllum distichum]|uniref:Calcium-binding EF-hand family protein n=1 Tax=Abeliophyllum distichum TaxID=126358 RepID=A0ABD1QJX8_9LAMI
MAVLGLRFLVLILFFISFVQCRTLRLNSSDDLISDGIDNVYNQYLVLSANVSIASANTCQHPYGFLPCAENAGGYIFQIVIYQGLLIFGEKQLGTGTVVLFNIFGTNKFVGVIVRILMGLPAILMMICTVHLRHIHEAHNLNIETYGDADWASCHNVEIVCFMDD